METAKNKRIFNMIMVVAIVLIAAIGIIAVGNVKGWFSKSEDSFATISRNTGTISLSRNGVSFVADKSTALKNDDEIKVEKNSIGTITVDENIFVINENSKIDIEGIDNNTLSMNLKSGEIFANLNDVKLFKSIIVDGWNFTADKSVFSINGQTGSMSVYVFEGNVCGTNGTEKISANSGELISIVNNKAIANKLTIESLNDFNLKNAKVANKTRKLCITNAQIDKVINERSAEAGKAGNSVLTIDGEIVTNGDGVSGTTSNGITSNTLGNTSKITEKTTAGSSNSKTTTKSSNSKTTTKSTNSKTTTKRHVDTSNVLHCTVEIRCDTILSNMQNLEVSKKAYVPDNGVILPTTRVEFYDGETAYDVLKRVCTSYGIQIEASYTPMYGSYYVEGINNLYEFDCGNESGWMYKVNGWFPNYGCSSYYIKDGTTIVWCYTCNGLGTDVGCEWMGE